VIAGRPGSKARWKELRQKFDTNALKRRVSVHDFEFQLAFMVHLSLFVMTIEVCLA
jgi:hypothetical protein